MAGIESLHLVRNFWREGSRWLALPALLWPLATSSCAPSASEPEPTSQEPEVATVRTALTSRAERWIATEAAATRFPLASAGKAAPLVVAAEDFAGVRRVAGHLKTDIGKVSGAEPVLVTTGQAPTGATEVVLIGTLGKSPLIDGLVASGKLEGASAIAGKWETFLVQSVDAPLAGVNRALVIAGSDKRGTIYGMYELSSQIGVSPWYYFADVPPKQQAELHVLEGAHSLGEPKVKYRGFFINDENPALIGWYNATFEPSGRFKSEFYEKVFELLMRMKGNYLWPAMWGKAFNADDPKNPELADEYGVVMGTSHHEPMTRAQQEWTEGGSGAWDYQQNKATLQRFWETAIERMGTRENIVTVGMRGDGDVAGTANRQQLEGIITDQRAILARVTGKDASAIPQVWALYKEVQDYYDQGMRVPDDVTLLFADDNWGNIRKLPKPGSAPRAGGYGVYYHYDYVGGPRNYKWINTNPIGRVWEQMHLAYQHKATQIWIVNVGDIKPMEFPLQFFLDYAWDPDKWPSESLTHYTRLWAEQQFGREHAPEIAELLSKYSRFNSRRKPELLSPSTYNLVNYGEAEAVVAEYNALAEKGLELNEKLPASARDAFYQLVLYPVQACANLNDLYVTAGLNQLYATQGRAATNTLATRARTLFAKDSELSNKYMNEIAGGKWAHMMDQTHIGYTDWQEPATQSMPSVRQITVPAAASLGVTVEGTESVWPGAQGSPTLSEFTPFQEGSPQYIEVFNKGTTAFDFSATSSVPWLTITPAQGSIATQQRLSITVDWAQAPKGSQDVAITITGPGTSNVVVTAPINNPETPSKETFKGLVQRDGYVSIEAEHFTTAVGTDTIRWIRIPELGRTLSGMTVDPSTTPRQTPGGASPHLEYKLHLFRAGSLRVRAYISPTLNYLGEPLRYAVSFDDGAPQTVNFNSDTSNATWERWVSDNINVSETTHNVTGAGEHVLKFWMVDAGVVLQKLVVTTGTAKATYLGPPATTPLGWTPPAEITDEPLGSGAAGAGTAGGASQPSGGGAPAVGSGGAGASTPIVPGAGNSGVPVSGTGGRSAAGGAAPGAGAPSGTNPGGSPSVPSGNDPDRPAPKEDGGCACGVSTRTSSGAWSLASLLLGLSTVRRRRKSRDSN